MKAAAAGSYLLINYFMQGQKWDICTGLTRKGGPPPTTGKPNFQNAEIKFD